MKSSLALRKSDLSRPQYQLEVLKGARIVGFKDRLKQTNSSDGLRADRVETLQINLGKMCNQTCAHCHVDAGPDRKEIMSIEVMSDCLHAVDRLKIKTVDLTGGAPEMNPNFRWFVEELSQRKVHIINRCNLTIIRAHSKYADLPQFFRQHQVEVVSSLPHFIQKKTDQQRGQGVFEKSIAALRSLNEAGYGKGDSRYKLNLVHNPSGAFLPGEQAQLEREFKEKLLNDYGVEFDQLFCITNLPVSRYLEYLIETENFESYMQELADAFNPGAVKNLMCRSLISVGWQGEIFDCDFNQMLELNLHDRKIGDVELVDLERRTIQVANHCYGCTAGAGSSCGGVIAENSQLT